MDYRIIAAALLCASTAQAQQVVAFDGDGDHFFQCRCTAPPNEYTFTWTGTIVLPDAPVADGDYTGLTWQMASTFAYDRFPDVPSGARGWDADGLDASITVLGGVVVSFSATDRSLTFGTFPNAAIHLYRQYPDMEFLAANAHIAAAPEPQSLVLLLAGLGLLGLHRVPRNQSERGVSAA